MVLRTDKFIPPSIHLVEQHNHVERKENLQARRGQESIKEEAHGKNKNFKTFRMNFAGALLPNVVINFVGRSH